MTQFSRARELQIKNSRIPKLSILIPARNEAARIGRCLESIKAFKDQPLEVLVLDDHSTDGTAEVVESFRHGLPQLKLIKSEALPEGWKGKNWACHQLAEAARGQWLLFLDADVVLLRGANGFLNQVLETEPRGLVTGFPYQVTKTWMEWLVVPMMMFLILCHLPVRFVRTKPASKYTAAHGGFLLFNKASYKKSGGHAAVKDAIVDDMALAGRMKEAGEPVQLMKVEKYVAMRMYESAREVFVGYSKNVFAGIGNSLSLLVFLTLVYAFLYLLPPVVLIAAGLSGHFAAMAAIGYFLGVIIKGTIDVSQKKNPISGFLLPVSIILTLFIAWNSARLKLTGKGYSWKGRRYQ